MISEIIILGTVDDSSYASVIVPIPKGRYTNVIISDGASNREIALSLLYTAKLCPYYHGTVPVSYITDRVRFSSAPKRRARLKYIIFIHPIDRTIHTEHTKTKINACFMIHKEPVSHYRVLYWSN